MWRWITSGNTTPSTRNTCKQKGKPHSFWITRYPPWGQASIRMKMRTKNLSHLMCKIPPTWCKKLVSLWLWLCLCLFASVSVIQCTLLCVWDMCACVGLVHSIGVLLHVWHCVALNGVSASVQRNEIRSFDLLFGLGWVWCRVCIWWHWILLFVVCRSIDFHLFHMYYLTCLVANTGKRDTRNVSNAVR